jgi:hypothetical protein
MSVEPRRGCGFRKVGGLYLVSGGRGVFCDRLPIALDVCPTCSHGIKQSRGWTWVDTAALVGGVHPQCEDTFACPLCMAPQDLGRSGLLWIGEKFYKSPLDFDREAAALGVSRRIAAIPRGFKVGEKWILLAHPKAVMQMQRCECGHSYADHFHNGFGPCGVCPADKCTLFQAALTPGIFKVWRPERIEKILAESQRGSAEALELIEKGITLVFVPDDDPDHRGSAHDKLGEEED